MKMKFINLTKKNGDKIVINPHYIIAMQPTDEEWKKQTGVSTYLTLALPISGCDVKETVEEIIGLIKESENEVQV